MGEGGGQSGVTSLRPTALTGMKVSAMSNWRFAEALYTGLFTER